MIPPLADPASVRARARARLALLLLGLGLTISCGGEGGGVVVKAPAPEAPAAPGARCASAPVAGTFGVVPLRNKTKRDLLLDGSDDLVVAALSGTGCFTLVERAQISALIGELKLCSDSNPDKVYFDCKGSFAKQGKILGVSRFVLGDVDAFEPDVKGAELALKIPGLPGIDAGRSYAALTLNLRVVDVESGQVLAAEVVHATVPADKAGLSASAGGLDLSVAVKNKTPFGEALDTVLRAGVARLQAKLR
jgi:curli biogenesis system outer membrane secretion channel CsgG